MTMMHAGLVCIPEDHDAMLCDGCDSVMTRGTTTVTVTRL